jgi:hypothetical protein
MAKGKRRRKPEKSARYKSNLARKKIAKEKKEKATRERWATDKEYLKKQAEKGYEKIDGKWVKTKK